MLDRNGHNARLSKIAGYALRFELPGANRDDIMVAFNQGCVDVYARARAEQVEETPEHYRYEAEEIITHHSVPLPSDADFAKAKVTLLDGQALVEIPRRM